MSILDFSFQPIIVIVIIVAVIFLFVQIFLKYFFKNENQNIKHDLIKYFDAKENINGEMEILLNGRKILIEHDWQNSYRGVSEYIISYIDITEIDKEKNQELLKQYGIINRGGKIYLKIFSSWGYRGTKFKERNLEVIDKFEN